MGEEKLVHVRVLEQFIDAVTGEYRYRDDEIDITQERMNQINNAGHGILVVVCQQKQAPKFGQKPSVK